MTHSMSQLGLDRLHQAMAARVAKGELPGLVSLVARGDEVWIDAIGSLAFGRDDSIRRDTIFRIASLTKPILALATMMLVEDGKLALDEAVDRFLPELANRKVLSRIDGPLDDTVGANRPITVEDLLTLRMGYGMIVEPTFEPPYPVISAANELELVLAPPDPRTPNHTPDEWIKRFGTLPLMCQPGERWQYNVGSMVLGVLVARAASQPLEDFFRTRIFEPLGMRNTGFSMPVDDAGRLASYYKTNSQTGKMELQQRSVPGEWTRPPAFPCGAGGLLSTVDDYLAFARVLLNNGVHQDKRLVSQKSVKLMTANHLTPGQIAGGGPGLGGQGWGFGMAVSVAPDDVSPHPGRYGWAGGYGTLWFNDPSRNLVAIFMTQTVDVMLNGTLLEFSKLAANS
jgi:CubicO group peptidase (beta-lactamase class C family)